MLEFNSMRVTLGLTWNEFYLCYLVQENTEKGGLCLLSRNEIAENCAITKQAVIDLVKKLCHIGYLENQSGKLKCSDKWSRNFADAFNFLNESGKESLPNTNLYGKESLPLSNSSDKESLSQENSPVKNLYQYTKDSGKESLPVNSEEVKILYHQNQETTVQFQEKDQNGKDSLPVDPSSNLYIYTNKDLLNNSISNNIEKGCGEKQKTTPLEKPKLYDLEYNDSTGAATCKVLHNTCVTFHKEKPDLYAPEMYKKFIAYWSAPNKKGIPLWHQKLSAKNGTWHLPGRLATWFENDQNFSNKQTQSNGTHPHKRGNSALRPTSIAQPSKLVGSGNVAHVEL